MSKTFSNTEQAKFLRTWMMTFWRWPVWLFCWHNYRKINSL